jgi:hypothetical protein
MVNWGWWFWLSEKIPNEHSTKEITFRVEFDTVRRIRHMFVVFMTAPRSIKIEST